MRNRRALREIETWRTASSKEMAFQKSSRRREVHERRFFCNFVIYFSGFLYLCSGRNESLFGKISRDENHILLDAIAVDVVTVWVDFEAYGAAQGAVRNAVLRRCRCPSSSSGLQKKVLQHPAQPPLCCCGRSGIHDASPLTPRTPPRYRLHQFRDAVARAPQQTPQPFLRAPES